MKALPSLLLFFSLSVTVAADPSTGGDGPEMEDGTLLRGAIPNHDESEENTFGGFHKHLDGYLRGLAEELNISLNETWKFLLQRQEFIEHTTDLHEDANFLESELADAPDGEFILRYKNGDVPQKSWESVEKFKKKHEDAVVNLVSTRLSRMDALERARRLSDILKKKAYTSVNYVTRGDDIHVTAKQPQGQGQGQGLRLLTRADAASILTLDDDHDDLVGLSLHLIGHDQEDLGQRFSDAYYRKGVGGTLMKEDCVFGLCNKPDSCTSGFSVKHKKSGKHGFLTAGHCGNPGGGAGHPGLELKYRKNKSGRKAWVPLKKEQCEVDRYGDYGWYSLKDEDDIDMEPYFWINMGDKKKEDFALFPVNKVLKDTNRISLKSHVFCYSRMSAKITAYKVAAPPSQPAYINGRQSADHILLKGLGAAQKGDSGGPCWGYDYLKDAFSVEDVKIYAVGLVTGNLQGHLVITKIRNAEKQLGVRLLTTDDDCSQSKHPCKVSRSKSLFTSGD